MSTTARTASVLAVITAALIIIIALAGCGGTAPSEAGCKAAMQASLASAIAAGQAATPAGKPPACNGLDDATIARLAAEVINSALNPSPEPS